MFAGYKRDIARQIEQEIGLARTADYTDQVYSAAYTLDQKLIKQQIAIINQDAPLPKHSFIGTPLPNISYWAATCKTLLESKIGSLILSDLQRHETMLRWVKEGYDYHRKHDLASCLFCGNFIPEERLSSLANIIDSKLNALISSISDNQEAGQRLQDQLVAIRSALPANNDLVKEHSSQFASVSDAKRLRALEDENRKLKKLLAESVLDQAALKELLTKKW
jgi:hypothetical protein